MEQTLLMDALLCEQLWRRHADRLLLYATTVLSDRAAAEDVLQNVFVRLIASPPSDVDSEAGYLFRAVRNEALNALASADADDKITILRLQQQVAVIDEIRTTLARYITAADVQDNPGSFA